MQDYEGERRSEDRRQGERRVLGCRRKNSVARAHSDDMMFRSGRRSEERRKFDRRQAA